MVKFVKHKLSKRSKERLTKLEQFLRTVPQKLFNLDFIVVSENGDVSELKHKDVNCGAAACAVGWCPVVFPRSFDYGESGYDNWDGTYAMSVEHKKTGLSDLDAAEKFFGLTPQACEYLFMPDAYREGHRGPITVANRIKKFVENERHPTESNYYNLLQGY